MGYCTPADVSAIVDSDMEPGEIDDLIDFISEVMDTILTTVNPTIRRGICALWTAYRCMLKDANARSLGEYSENRAVALQLMKEELDKLLATGGAIIPIPVGGGVKLVATMEPL